MKVLLVIPMLLLYLVSAAAAITLAVSQQSGAAVQERARQLARQIGSELGTPVEVVTLADAGQVEDWLNRYATAELALVEPAFVSRQPGRFVKIGPVGSELLIGRQGVSGDLPERLAGMLAGRGERVASTAGRAAASPRTSLAQQEPVVIRKAVVESAFSSAKTADEDRYFVGYAFRERLHREPDAEHLEYWTQQLQRGTITRQQLFALDCDLEKMSCGNR